jgi:hypothetical protein
MSKGWSVLVLLALAGCNPSVRTADRARPVAPTEVYRTAIQQALLQDTYPGVGDPEPVKLEQIAIDSTYALATWTRGETGGQALLRWEEGSWKVLINEAGWLGLRRLRRADVPEVVCRSLLEQIDPNWVSYEVF